MIFEVNEWIPYFFIDISTTWRYFSQNIKYLNCGLLAYITTITIDFPVVGEVSQHQICFSVPSLMPEEYKHAYSLTVLLNTELICLHRRILQKVTL